jgi:hypothetical protein
VDQGCQLRTHGRLTHPFALRNVVGMSGTKLVNRLRARDAADDDEALALIR